MSKIIEYYATTASNIGRLCELVNGYIKKGWQPIGGITFMNGTYCQSLVRYES